MKKIIFILSLLVVTSISFADDSVSLRDLTFQNLQMPKTTVKKALKLNSRTSINLEGKITQYLSDENFKFEDGTASIIIVIKDNVLSKSEVPLNELVKINGDILKKGHKNVIYVNKIENLLNKSDKDTKSDFNLITIREAKKYPEGSIIALSGKFIKYNGNQKYIFKDETGKIKIKIDNSVYFESVPLNKEVTIRGVVNKYRTIDVDKIY